MTYEQWQKYGPEGPPPEECNNDPICVVQAVVDFLTSMGFDNATKKKVRAIIAKDLTLRRGRPQGSGLKEHTTEAFELYRQGWTEHQIGERFGLSAADLTLLMARIRAKKSKLHEEERRAFSLTRFTAISARKRAPTHNRTASARKPNLNPPISVR
jgi:hypothetical protein